jgi:hypothetical protein
MTHALVCVAMIITRRARHTRANASARKGGPPVQSRGAWREAALMLHQIDRHSTIASLSLQACNAEHGCCRLFRSSPSRHRRALRSREPSPSGSGYLRLRTQIIRAVNGQPIHCVRKASMHVPAHCPRACMYAHLCGLTLTSLPCRADLKLGRHRVGREATRSARVRLCSTRVHIAVFSTFTKSRATQLRASQCMHRSSV